jgi:hypothetical protein
MLKSEYLKEALAFLDGQRLMEPCVNEQVGFDFQGLRKSYRDDPEHPDARLIARFNRVWIYDAALAIYADLKARRFRQAGYQAGRVMQLALREEEKGYQGLWHFSYNTKGDLFIDCRGPAGANAWCLNALYAYVLATGDTSPLAWLNRSVRDYLFKRQVTDSQDPRFGLVRAGLYNADDASRGDAMGYRTYEGRLNHPYQHVILEHNAASAGTFRLAFRATQRHLPREKDFLEALIHRHDLLLTAMRRAFWQGDHFVSAMDENGRLYLGTDRLPSVAVDNNTWSAHQFLPYDLDLARAAIRYVEKRFILQRPPARVEGMPGAPLPQPEGSLPGPEGLYYFPETFVDPFVLVAPEDRKKMQETLQPEAAFGFILFLMDASGRTPDSSERQRLEARALSLYEQAIRLLRLYGPLGSPYASANVPAIFSTLNSVTTAATGVITTAILQGVPGDDFIGVAPPPEFVVDGKRPV